MRNRSLAVKNNESKIYKMKAGLDHRCTIWNNSLVNNVAEYATIIPFNTDINLANDNTFS